MRVTFIPRRVSVGLPERLRAAWAAFNVLDKENPEFIAACDAQKEARFQRALESIPEHNREAITAKGYYAPTFVMAAPSREYQLELVRRAIKNDTDIMRDERMQAWASRNARYAMEYLAQEKEFSL